MGYGKIPPGGLGSPDHNKLPESSDQRTLKGRFNTSGATRDVSAKPGKTHIPAADALKSRPLDEWEVTVQEVEFNYFSKAAEFSDDTFKGKGRVVLKEEVADAHKKLFAVLNQYNQRVTELQANDRIRQNDALKILPTLIRKVIPVVELLKDLEKSLAPKASNANKKEPEAVLKETRDLLASATTTLAEAKANISESTLPEPVVKPLSNPVQPTPKKPANSAHSSSLKDNKKQDNKKKTNKKIPDKGVIQAPPEQRLKSLRLQLTKAKSDEMPYILRRVRGCFEEISQQFGQAISEDTDPASINEKLQNQEHFLKSLGALAKLADGTITSANVSSARVEAKDRIFICDESVRRILKIPLSPKSIEASQPDLQQASHTYLAPSDIHFAPLKAQVEALSKSSSEELQMQPLQRMHQYLVAEKQRMKALLPLLSVVDLKSHFQGESLPKEVEVFYEALKTLDQSINLTKDSMLDKSLIACIKDVDRALMILDSFDQQLPESFWRVLTVPVANEHGVTPHLVNVMCRHLLSKETGPLSGRASIKKLARIGRYLEQVKNKNPEDLIDSKNPILNAFEKVKEQAFSDPAQVRALMTHVQSLEEVQEVGRCLSEWSVPHQQLLDTTCDKLQKVKMDYPLPEVEAGKEALNQMTGEFIRKTNIIAEQQSNGRLKQLEAAVKKSIEDIVREQITNPGILDQFRSTQKLCEKIQGELNKELGSIASVTLTPGKSSGDIIRRVNVRFQDVEKDGERINAFLNGKGKYTAELRGRILAGEQKDLLQLDQIHNRWHWVPYPATMVRKFANDFVTDFAKYDKALKIAEDEADILARHLTAKTKVTDLLPRVKRAIPTFKNLKTKIRSPSKKKLTKNQLNSLNTHLEAMGAKPLSKLAEETENMSGQVVNMLKQQRLNTREAIAILSPLYELRQSVEGRTAAIALSTQPLPPKFSNRTPEMASVLKELEKKYLINPLGRIFNRKRLKALKTAKALVEVCEACPHASFLNIKMLDTFIEELNKRKSKHSDYSRLENALTNYAGYLHKSISSAQIINSGS